MGPPPDRNPRRTPWAPRFQKAAKAPDAVVPRSSQDTLKLIYDAQALGLSPSTPPPEVLEPIRKVRTYYGDQHTARVQCELRKNGRPQLTY
jgi:hypothetical protein